MADGLREVVAPLVVCFQRIPLRHVDDEHLSPHRMQVLHLGKRRPEEELQARRRAPPLVRARQGAGARLRRRPRRPILLLCDDRREGPELVFRRDAHELHLLRGRLVDGQLHVVGHLHGRVGVLPHLVDEGLYLGFCKVQESLTQISTLTYTA